MTKICAWCGAALSTPKSVSSDETGMVSHGVCPSCAATLRARCGTELSSYVEKLGVPVLILDSDCHVLAGSSLAGEYLGTTGERMRNRYIGQVFECEYSQTSEGCGRSIHCSGCTIRRVVRATFHTGEAYHRVQAVVRHESGGIGMDMRLSVSTARVKEGVLLRIDEITAAAHEY